MYHAIVRRKITSAFAGLSAGRIEAITDELSPGAEHYFVGTHALSGTRRTPEAIRAWRENGVRGKMEGKWGQMKISPIATTPATAPGRTALGR